MKPQRIIKIILLIAIGYGLNTSYCISQDVKLSRQEKKEFRKAQMEMNFYILDTLLTSRSFVLVADFLKDKYGGRVNVVPSLNFIKITGSTGILQTGSNTGLGYNGVGGTTAEGSIGSYEIHKKPKNLTYNLQFNIMSNIGSYDVFMTVTSDNHALATISGLGPGSLTWEGHLESVKNSRVFKGQNTY